MWEVLVQDTPFNDYNMFDLVKAVCTDGVRPGDYNSIEISKLLMQIRNSRRLQQSFQQVTEEMLE